MFTRVEIRNFRALKEVDVKLRKFHVLVGPNASGKSTFLDAFVFVGELLSEGVVGALRKRKLKWEDISHNRYRHNTIEFRFEITLPTEILKGTKLEPFDSIRYELAIWNPTIGNGDPLVKREACWLFKAQPDDRVDWRDLMTKPGEIDIWRLDEAHDLKLDSAAKYIAVEVMRRWGSKVDYRNCIALDSKENNEESFSFDDDALALAKIQEDVLKYPAFTWLKNVFLRSIQTISLESETINRASSEGRMGIVSRDGSNLPWLIDSLRKLSPEQYKDWLQHIKTGLRNIDSIKCVSNSEGNEKYIKIKYKEGYEVKSWMVSDGTLRILLLTLIAYHPNLKGLFLIEEPEIGIHPQTIEIVMQSLRSVYQGQVFITTHSSDVVNSIHKDELLCFSKNKSGETTITIGKEHSRLENWDRSISLGELFGSGVFD